MNQVAVISDISPKRKQRTVEEQAEYDERIRQIKEAQGE